MKRIGIDKNKLKKIMKDRNIKNQNELAASMGISKNQLSVILSDKFTPIKSNVERMCQILDIGFDEIMDIEELAYKLVERLQTYYPEKLKERYKIEEVFENPLDTLDAIALKRGCIMKGKAIDYTRIAVILLDEFRGGKIGTITLERP